MITLVTVTHLGEIPLLSLQAKSLALHVRDLQIDEILIVINDRDEERAGQRIIDMIPNYGWLSNKVRIVTAQEVFLRTRLRDGWKANLLSVFSKYPRLQLIDRSGWNGNDGWRIQQAFKLAVARVISSPLTVILDSKNIFISQLAMSDFVDPNGEPLARFMAITPKLRTRVRNSCKALGFPNSEIPGETTSYVTPFCIKTSVLRDFLEAAEAQGGPVQSIFAFRLNDLTEFMLINAFCNLRLGGIRSVFREGIVRSFTIWRDDTLMNSILSAATRSRAKCI